MSDGAGGAWSYTQKLAPNRIAFASALQRLRIARKLTHARAAARGGAPLGVIGGIAAGRMPRLSTVCGLALSLDVNAGELARMFGLPIDAPIDAVLATRYAGAGRDEETDRARAARFARVVRMLRGDRTQSAIGARTGIDASIVGALERGRTADPTLATTWRLSVALAPEVPHAALRALVNAYAGEATNARRMIARGASRPTTGPADSVRPSRLAPAPALT